MIHLNEQKRIILQFYMVDFYIIYTYNPSMKEGMSSFDIAAMVKELQCLIEGRIDKAFQLTREKLLLRIRVPEKGRKDLVIVVGKWLYLATQPQETPKTPTSFAMLLRKYLGNGKITKIEQHGFDRIAVFAQNLTFPS